MFQGVKDVHYVLLEHYLLFDFGLSGWWLEESEETVEDEQGGEAKEGLLGVGNGVY